MAYADSATYEDRLAGYMSGDDPEQQQQLKPQVLPQSPAPIPSGPTPGPTPSGSQPPAYSGSDPQAFIKQWQQSHQASEGIGPLADALKSQYNIGRYMYGQTPSNNEVMLPSGEKFKVMGGEDNPNSAYWYQPGMDDSAGGAGGRTGGPGAYVPGQGAPGQGTVFGGSKLGSENANALYSTLMKRAGQSLMIDRNDPLIRNQADSFGASQQRAQRNYETQLAERVGANGNIGMERRAGAEKVAQNTSAYEGQLMQHERDARRQEIQSALSGAQGLLTSEQQMMLQEELSQLGLAQSAYQFDVNDQFRNSPLGG